MPHRRTGWLITFEKLSVFALALLLVIVFFIALDDFAGSKMIYLIRTGNLETLATLIILGFIIRYILQKLLILQWRWGVER